VNSRRFCDVCKTNINIGLGGESNWTTHINRAVHTHAQAALQKNNLSNYFSKAPMQPAPSSVIPPTRLSNGDFLREVPPYYVGPQADITSTSGTLMDDNNQDGGPEATDLPGSLIDQLRVATERLPKTVLVATEDDILAQFSGTPFVDPTEYEDAWEMVDKALNGVIGYSASIVAVSAVICRGRFGMDGLCNWLETCITELGINPELLEGKIQRLLDAMNLMCVPTHFNLPVSCLSH
jgi:hypothetical protein